MKKPIYFLRKHLPALMMIFFITGMASKLSAQVTDGLVVHYTFEEISNGTIADVTGNGNDAYVYDGATVGIADDESGKNVLSLTGAGYVTIGEEGVVSTASATLGNLSDYSIATWVKIDAHNFWNRLFDFGISTDYYMFLTTSVGSEGRIQYSIKNGSGAQDMSSPTVLPTGEWMHIALTSNAEASVLYINGQVAAKSTLTYTPANSIGEANFTSNYIGKSHYSADALFTGSISDFRIYNRGLTETEIAVLNGIPEELIAAKQDVIEQMSAYYLNMLEDNISLPTSSGNVVVDWETSNADIITAEGVITKPSKYAESAVLTAVLSYQGDTITTTFGVTVLPVTLASELVAQFKFDDDLVTPVTSDSITVTDLSDNAWVGVVENSATVLSYGTTDPVNVLYTGTDGYFDLGTDIGEAISSLNDYTFACYFRIDDNYTNLGSNGNFLWAFANTSDMGSAPLGGIYLSLAQNNFKYRLTPTDWSNANSINVTGLVSQGGWHHVAISQYEGNAYLYLDGVQVGTSGMTYTPALNVKNESFPATLFNWLGRSCYAGDANLGNTMLYDFRIYNVGLTADDAPYVFVDEDRGWYEVSDVIDALNLAVAEGQNLPTTLQDEHDALDLGDLTSITTDITLPTVGSIDTDVTIEWESSNPSLISNAGAVNRPDFFNGTTTLTATLRLGLNSLVKTFKATVLVKEGTEFTNDLLVQFNFADELVETVDLNDTTTVVQVTDAAEKGFVGTLVNGAEIRSMTGPMQTYHLLYLQNDSAYFDMGTEIGKVIYGLGKHYSTSIWYYIHPSKTNLSNNGNFLYAFSNSATSDVDQNGYMFGRAYSNEHTVSEFYWASGNQDVRNDTIRVDQGYWHHFAYVQNDTMGVVYVDGDTMSIERMTNYPGSVIPKDTLVGTIANFLGRANFTTDAYLGKALLADFRVYGKSLSFDEITELYSVSEDIELSMILDDPLAAKEIQLTPSNLKIYSPRKGEIKVAGKSINEKVYVYDITGRLMQVSTQNSIKAKAGIHIVKVGSAAFKVVVH